MRVLIAAGGTAGHVFPGIALAEELRDQLGAKVRFVGTASGQESKLVPTAGFPLATAPARPFHRGLSLAAVRAPLTALRAASICRPLVREVDVVVGMGGFVSVPASLAAWRAKVPLVLHEQNAVPGLANRLSARWAQAIALAFEDARPRLPARVRNAVTGTPIRASVLRVRDERAALRDEAMGHFELDSGRQTIVVFGGSQGALHLDRDAAGASRLLASRQDLQFLVITGPAHARAFARPLTTDGLLLRTLPFVERMELVYSVADLVVARAGASTVAEVSACGIPALLIPYPYATARHQEANARALKRAGAASVLLDDELTPSSLADRIGALIDHPERLKAMAEAAERFGKPDAAAEVADLVRSVSPS
ncbi:MAG: undecaprenyldiphospho-muramoylpentapeptide beta-N-acetylglucosaminyltransferase [Actinomycetota bacterium]